MYKSQQSNTAHSGNRIQQETEEETWKQWWTVWSTYVKTDPSSTISFGQLVEKWISRLDWRYFIDSREAQGELKWPDTMAFPMKPFTTYMRSLVQQNYRKRRRPISRCMVRWHLDVCWRRVCLQDPTESVTMPGRSVSRGLGEKSSSPPDCGWFEAASQPEKWVEE